MSTQNNSISVGISSSRFAEIVAKAKAAKEALAAQKIKESGAGAGVGDGFIQSLDEIRAASANNSTTDKSVSYTHLTLPTNREV